MPTSEKDRVGPPRAIAWVLLLTSAAAVLLIGLVGTALIFGNVAASPSQVGARFWIRLLVASGLTIASLGLRSLRWVFLLRRAETRIPIRDAYIGYCAGLSLLFVPFLLGEITLRAVVLRARGSVPVATTVIVNLWERLLDLAALATIGGALAIVLGAYEWGIALLAVVAVLFITPVRRMGLGAAVAIGRKAGRRWDAPRDVAFGRLARSETWLAGLMSSILVWILPGVGFWIVAHAWPYPFSLAQAEYAYATSASLGGLVLSPGGVLVAGTRLLEVLQDAQFPAAPAALTVLGIRLATAGVATIFGGLFLLLHLRSPRPVEALHFDEIADAYDVQIPEARRTALLTRKTTLMREALERLAPKGRGLDAGCGHGTYVARMRELGFDVYGIDMSAGQIQIAERNVGGRGLVTTGSLLQIPARDSEYDFAYAINVLHHLSSMDEQRRAFAELLRVLKPGGLLFVHEINTRNLLFRFYMGYVFPSLNCIDEGVERWLLPHELRVYTDVPVIDIRYFTFLPEFLPEPLVQILAPVERLLEVSPLRIYSAHYMAVLQKGGSHASGGGPRVG